ncbi:hypothetical protein [Polyangium mundeleinium]|uniref:ScyD/ScyE family protein n=1 Tax=Polyangium mundeleinium TaxID=2995306 RepID=A0ABT5EFD8_9BACT|nr:hypothetical protein [Polyangium mundeleinium]MDC0740496.1 hypothetical protein [Polyangium mundeleinium]
MAEAAGRTDPRRPWGVEVAPNGHVFAIDGGETLEDAPSGRALELDREGKVITSWGGFGHEEGQFDTGHDITVGPDGSVYVVEQVGATCAEVSPQNVKPRFLPVPLSTRLGGW